MKNLRRSIVCLLVFLLAFGVLPLPAVAQTGAAYDVVIRNGRVLDGAGNPWILADVAIKDGKFARIGQVEGKGKREIDARGSVLEDGASGTRWKRK